MILFSFNIFVSLLSIILQVLCLFLFAEYVASCLKTSKSYFQDSTYSKNFDRSQVRTAILVPAHNEESDIKSTVNYIKDILKPQDRLIVIADNCNDSTASIARSCGAIVLEREDADNRGKGYALDYGLQYLDSAPPDIVVCIDADCQIASDALDRLVEVAVVTGQPVQSLYLLNLPDQPAFKQRIIAFATKIRNYIRPLGASRLGIPNLLLGSGMAFPWSVIRSADIATSNLVEDIKLGLDLAILGTPPIFCPEARVISCLPSQDTASKSQKTRWEQGHLQLIKSYVPHLIKESLIQRRLSLALLALDLAIPPMTIFVFCWVAVMFASIVISLSQGQYFSLLMSVISGALLMISVLGSWVRIGRDLPIQLLLVIPIYIAWKIPVYLSMIFKPQKEWIRTERD